MPNHTDLTLPGFNPRFVDEEGMGLHYEDGRIVGAVDVYDLDDDGKQIVISEWESAHRHQGCSVQALRWFREQGFNSIVANAVGTLEEEPDGTMVGDIATNYWAHMHTKGLVDVLLDDDQRRIVVSEQGKLSYATETGKARLSP